jgi:hypothetical protein
MALAMLLLAGLALARTAGAEAEALAVPEGKVILSVSGSIGRTNADGTAQLDRAMLEALPRTEFATSTVWTEGVSTYSGVLLRDLLDMLGADGTRIVASAIDGYQVVIPIAELKEDGPILAFLRDGQPMPVRERGPLWLIYPFDDNPAFRNETTYARSIWQLTLIDVER